LRTGRLRFGEAGARRPGRHRRKRSRGLADGGGGIGFGLHGPGRRAPATSNRGHGEREPVRPVAYGRSSGWCGWGASPRSAQTKTQPRPRGWRRRNWVRTSRAGATRPSYIEPWSRGKRAGQAGRLRALVGLVWLGRVAPVGTDENAAAASRMAAEELGSDFTGRGGAPQLQGSAARRNWGHLRTVA
jgi:hypothetical protein